MALAEAQLQGNKQKKVWMTVLVNRINQTMEQMIGKMTHTYTHTHIQHWNMSAFDAMTNISTLLMFQISNDAVALTLQCLRPFNETPRDRTGHGLGKKESNKTNMSIEEKLLFWLRLPQVVSDPPLRL